MGWPQPNPETVQQALDWLRQQDARLTLDALRLQLREAGYAEPEITAAVAARQAELDAALPPGSDLRGRAAAILVVTFLAAWGILSLALLTGEPLVYDSGGAAAFILSAALLPMLLLGLAIVRVSGRLKRGAAGAMVMVLIVPFIYLVVVAGLCVATTQPFN